MKKFVEFLESFIVIALVLAGVTGLSFDMFRDTGWLETMLGNIWDLDTQYMLIAIPVLIGAVVVFKLWRGNRVIHSKTSMLPNLLLYGMIGAGVYYIGRYVLTGSI